MEISKNNYEIVYIGIVFIYFIIGVLYVIEGSIPKNYIIIILFFMFKMITMYEKCTISYLECKLRNVKKENGYLYDFLHSITILRNKDYAKYLYSIAIIFIIFYTKQITKQFFNQHSSV